MPHDSHDNEPEVEASSDDLISTSDAGRIVGVSDETMRRWAAAKKVRHVRTPSGRVLFRRADVEALLHPVEAVEAVS